MFNIDLGKILGSELVQAALIGMSIFTGGVAIANGIMTGFSQASAAQGFMTKFVEGAAGFVKGAAQGFLNPIETAKSLPGKFQGLLGGNATGGGQLTEALASAPSDASNIVESIAGDTDIVEMGVGGQGIDQYGVERLSQEAALAATPSDLSLAGMQAQEAANQAAIGSAQDTLANAGYQTAEQSMTTPEINIPEGMGVESTTPEAAQAASASGKDALDSVMKVASETAKDAAEEEATKGFWGNFKDFASSPQGIQTMLGMANGYSEAEMLRKAWDQRDRYRRDVANSWATAPAPRTRAIRGRLPTLQQLRDQTAGMGNQAGAKYGY